jgi:hypothetical protein
MELKSETFAEKVLVVLASLAAACSGAEEAHVPGGRHASVAENAAHELEEAGEIVAIDCGIFGERGDLADKLRGEAFVGVEMELPGVLDGDIGDGPVALGAIVFKGMMDDRGTGGLGEGDGVVGAAGVDDVDVVGEAEKAAQGCRKGVGGVESEDDDGWLQGILGVGMGAAL